jgi:hypothetical protein
LSQQVADIDRILEAIRAEARARGSRGPIGEYPREVRIDAQPAPPQRVESVALHDLQHVADYLALPLDVFVAEAYRRMLGRDADPQGADHYRRSLLRGRLTRVEVLGRLVYAPEGRARGTKVPGLAAAFALATLYRIPIAGPLAAFAARLLRLPSHLQDRSTVEATAFATGDWLKR